MNLRVTVQPASEPVTLAEFKAHQRIDGSDEDDLLQGYLAAARQACELEARRAFVTQTLQLTLDNWPCTAHLTLPRPPLQSVSGVIYVDNAGASHTMSAADYIVDASSEPGRIWLAYGKSWPSETLQPGPAITISFVAGYGSPVDVPPIYKQAILLTAGHYYENREEITVQPGLTILRLPAGAQSLLMLDRGWH